MSTLRHAMTMAGLLAALMLGGCAGSGGQTPDQQAGAGTGQELSEEQKKEARDRMIEAARAPANQPGHVEKKYDEAKKVTKYQLLDLRLIDESGPQTAEFESVEEKGRWIASFQSEEREEIVLEAQWVVPEEGAADETVTLVARTRSFQGKRYGDCHGFDLLIDGESIDISRDIQYDGFVITGENVSETVAVQLPLEQVGQVAEADEVTLELCESSYTFGREQLATFGTYWKAIRKQRESAD